MVGFSFLVSALNAIPTIIFLFLREGCLTLRSWAMANLIGFRLCYAAARLFLGRSCYKFRMPTSALQNQNSEACKTDYSFRQTQCSKRNNFNEKLRACCYAGTCIHETWIGTRHCHYVTCELFKHCGFGPIKLSSRKSPCHE